MGIETIIFASLTALQASRTMQAGQKQAKQIVRQGELAGKEKAKEIRHKAARQTVSFLNSGLELTGTPESVIGETFAVGKEDIAQIASNTNVRSKATIGAARTAAIGKIASSFAMSSFGDMLGGGSPADISAPSAGGIGQSIGGNALDLSSTGFSNQPLTFGG